MLESPQSQCPIQYPLPLLEPSEDLFGLCGVSQSVGTGPPLYFPHPPPPPQQPGYNPPHFAVNSPSPSPTHLSPPSSAGLHFLSPAPSLSFFQNPFPHPSFSLFDHSPPLANPLIVPLLVPAASHHPLSHCIFYRCVQHGHNNNKNQQSVHF